jgi:tetratricopeptide (TPR) repeat protein
LKESLKKNIMSLNTLIFIRLQNSSSFIKTKAGLPLSVGNRLMILTFFITTTTLVLNAQNNEKLFSTANQMYQTGNYTAAANQYEEILKSGILSKEIYYNLGNAYYRLNHIGRAMLNYERALRFSPTDSDILHNIAMTKAKLTDDIESVDDTFIVRWVRQLRGVLSSDGWSSFGLFFLWMGVGGLVIWMWGKQRVWKKRGFVAGLILIPLSCVPFLLAKSAIWAAQSNQYAIIMVAETPLRAVPDLNANATLTLHEGLKIMIQESNTQFFNVRLPNGEVGWIEHKVVEKI